MSIKLKTRHDGYTDQFNRIFMTKMLLICSIVMCVDYFADQINCMVPKNARHSKGTQVSLHGALLELAMIYQNLLSRKFDEPNQLNYYLEIIFLTDLSVLFNN